MAKILACPFSWCKTRFATQHGRTYHVRSIHSLANIRRQSSNPQNPNLNNEQEPLLDPNLPHSDFEEDLRHDSLSIHSPSPLPSPRLSPGPDVEQPGRRTHPYLTGTPCDVNGNYLPPNTPPPPRAPAAPDDWAPFDSQQQFELADLLFRKVQMSATNIDELLSIWGLSSDDIDSLN
ncbi:hypothetical protein AB1N83_010434 [Pleurotus pulmonarius]